MGGIDSGSLKIQAVDREAPRGGWQEIKEISLPTSSFLAVYYVVIPAKFSNMARFDGVKYGVRKTATIAQRLPE